MKKITLLLPIFSLLLMLTSCVYQDQSECIYTEKVVVKFAYSYNADDTDKVVTDVTRMELYAFDSHGKFAGRWHTEGSAFVDRMTIDLEVGTYSFIAWGGETGSTSYTVTPLEVGKTTIDQIRLSLTKAAGNTVSDKFYNLYYGSLNTYSVKIGDNFTEIPLIRNTNDVKVVAHNIHTQLETPPTPGDNTALDVFHINITGDNAYHKFDNTFDITSPTDANVVHIPYSRQTTDKDIETDFRVMRLRRGVATKAVTDNSINLIIKNSQSGVILHDLNIVDQIIAQHPHIKNNASGLTPDQAIDKYSDYRIDIYYVLADVKVYVTIDDWTVCVINGDME